MTRPTERTDWATQGAGGGGGSSALRTATDSARWTLGWQTEPSNDSGETGERPNLNMQNYWQYAVHQWKEYLEIQSPPALTGAVDTDALTSHMTLLRDGNAHPETQIGSILHGFSLGNSAYAGGVYSPHQNRIYMAPDAQSSNATWHYYDCDTGVFVSWARGGTVGANAYWGGAYSPNQNRIYFAPHTQSNQTDWHYIDCIDGSLNAYTHGATVVATAYKGAVYSPTQDRIYFIPYFQSAQANWHYIDCTDGTVNAYAHGAGSVTSYGFNGGVYSPTQNKIYFAPYNHWTYFFYLDCDDGSVGSTIITHSVGTNGYVGAAYSPTQDRVYYAPYGAADNAQWHYTDCSDNTLHSYTHGFGTSLTNNGFAGAVYMPALNRIVFMACYHGYWYFVDCDDGSVYHQVDLVGSTPGGAYVGGVYSPTENKVICIPSGSSDTDDWHFIQDYSGKQISRQLMAHSTFNGL